MYKYIFTLFLTPLPLIYPTSAYAHGRDEIIYPMMGRGMFFWGSCGGLGMGLLTVVLALLFLAISATIIYGRQS